MKLYFLHYRRCKKLVKNVMHKILKCPKVSFEVPLESFAISIFTNVNLGFTFCHIFFSTSVHTRNAVTPQVFCCLEKWVEILHQLQKYFSVWQKAEKKPEDCMHVGSCFFFFAWSVAEWLSWSFFLKEKTHTQCHLSWGSISRSSCMRVKQSCAKQFNSSAKKKNSALREERRSFFFFLGQFSIASKIQLLNIYVNLSALLGWVLHYC